MQERHIWGWPIPGYLFLGGLGGGMVIVSSASDLFWSAGKEFAIGSLVAAGVLALGCILLLLDLGRPLQFWRVLSRQKAVMTAGAWMLGVLIITCILYFSFWLNFTPWSDLIWSRHAFAWLNLILGLGVCIYTGILLGSMKARPFWNTPVLPILFLVSGISTGIAGQALLVGLWPSTGPANVGAIHSLLRAIDLGLIFFELVIIFIYVLMMGLYNGKDARRVTISWLTGVQKWLFWVGLIGLGLLFPGVFYFVADRGAGVVLTSAFVLAGGFILRLLIVYSDRRKELPDETLD
jgi:formate-dependent nitrite reductase membrane component NrfD